jgi:hypothetical protein
MYDVSVIVYEPRDNLADGDKGDTTLWRQNGFSDNSKHELNEHAQR